MRGTSEEGLYRVLGGSFYIRKAFTTLYFLAIRNLGTFELPSSNEAIVDALGSVYVVQTDSMFVEWVGMITYTCFAGCLPLLVPR